MCWSYEHFRDCPSFIDRVLEWRKEQKSYPDLPPECFTSEPYERVITQWPESPYLEIAPEIRRLHHRIRSIMGLSEIISFQSQKKEVALFPVPDWSLSNNELKKRFEQWIEENRPHDCTIRERRGRSTTRFVKAALKALGAYRLSRVMSQNEVINFALAHDRPLYRNQPELSKMLKRTASYLAWLDQAEAS